MHIAHEVERILMVDLAATQSQANEAAPTTQYRKYTFLNSNINLFDIIKHVTIYLVCTNRRTSLLFSHINDGSKIVGFFINLITS
jgi:hypothetical protein